MRRLCYCDSVGTVGSVGFLVLRLVMGAAFVLHGWPKIQNLTTWMGDQQPALLQALAAIAEFGGGIALILGFLTRLAALGLGATMVGALVLYHLPEGHDFVPSKPGEPSFELAAVYLACSFVFLLLGPGRISLDALLFGKVPETTATPGMPLVR
jgi:putative oxidoreductase